MHAGSGFTLIELMAVITVMSMLTVAVFGPEIRVRAKEFEQIQIDVTIEEIRRLGSMAQTFTLYNNGDWPDAGNDCHNSYQYLQLTSLDEISPLYFPEAIAVSELPFAIAPGADAHFGKYYFNCLERPLHSDLRPWFIVYIALDGSHKHWASYIANQVAGAEVVSKSDNLGVKISWPLLSAIPALAGLLPRDGSRPMLGDLDMAGHAISDLGDISLREGQSLGGVPLLHVVAKPGNQIRKPACPNEYVPQIIVLPKEIAHSSGQPITKFKVWADDQGSSWRINSEVHDITSPADSNRENKVLTTVIVKCAL